MHELAGTLVIERYNLTRLVDRLEQEGLVTRAWSPDNERAITDAGRALRKRMWKIYEATAFSPPSSTRRHSVTCRMPWIVLR